MVSSPAPVGLHAGGFVEQCICLCLPLCVTSYHMPFTRFSATRKAKLGLCMHRSHAPVNWHMLRAPRRMGMPVCPGAACTSTAHGTCSTLR